MSSETHGPAIYQKVIYRPGDSSRARSVILRDPREKDIQGHRFLLGEQANKDGSYWGSLEQKIDRRICVIPLVEIQQIIPMAVSKKYSWLEEVKPMQKEA
jgi:hypothetical protein